MKRILLVLSLTAVMVMGMAAPAMAAAPIGGCPPSFDKSFGLVPVEFVLAGTGLTLDSPGVESIDVNNDGKTCLKLIDHGRAVFADNHFPL